jgi:hypothetical protein
MAMQCSLVHNWLFHLLLLLIRCCWHDQLRDMKQLCLRVSTKTPMCRTVLSVLTGCTQLQLQPAAGMPATTRLPIMAMQGIVVH